MTEKEKCMHDNAHHMGLSEYDIFCETCETGWETLGEFIEEIRNQTRKETVKEILAFAKEISWKETDETVSPCLNVYHEIICLDMLKELVKKKFGVDA